MDLLWPNDNWTRVELYRLVYGRLPTHTSDTITSKTLKTFLEKWEAGELLRTTVNVTDLAEAIVCGEVLTSAALARRRKKPVVP